MAIEIPCLKLLHANGQESVSAAFLHFTSEMLSLSQTLGCRSREGTDQKNASQLLARHA